MLRKNHQNPASWFARGDIYSVSTSNTQQYSLLRPTFHRESDQDPAPRPGSTISCSRHSLRKSLHKPARRFVTIGTMQKTRFVIADSAQKEQLLSGNTVCYQDPAVRELAETEPPMPDITSISIVSLSLSDRDRERERERERQREQEGGGRQRPPIAMAKESKKVDGLSGEMARRGERLHIKLPCCWAAIPGDGSVLICPPEKLAMPKREPQGLCLGTKPLEVLAPDL